MLGSGASDDDCAVPGDVSATPIQGAVGQHLAVDYGGQGCRQVRDIEDGGQPHQVVNRHTILDRGVQVVAGHLTCRPVRRLRFGLRS
jgi:hypothetical protein